MGFFTKMFEAPRAPKDDEHEKSQANLQKIREIKKEYGHSHAATILNERIEKNKNKGDYSPDEKLVELERLESEYQELLDNPKIQEYLNESNKIMEVQSRIKELKEYLERVLTDQDSKETDYKEKALELSANKKDEEYISQKINQMDDETISLVDKFILLEDKIKTIKKELEEKYGNQDIKTEQGQYLN